MQIYPPGTRIGQYEVASNPMIGGMGVVYFCLDHENNGRPVALKTFRSEFLPDRATRDRFLREGTAWIELGSHPHIVRCYAVEYIDPTAFLVLELIAKEQGMQDASLRSWLGAPMPVEQALLFALQIARGMGHATERIAGLVHRDLKPENILVGADRLSGTDVNRLRITDFGLAAVLQNETSRLPEEDSPRALGRTHLTRGILGTPLYMAPEQWKGEPLGVYTDVYALGCILLEMLTGKYPVDGHTLGNLQAAHCCGKLRPMPQNLPAIVRILLGHCLALSATERYSSWDQLMAALEKAYGAVSRSTALAARVTAQTGLEERRQEGWSYNSIGQAYHDMGKAEVAAGYFERAIEIARTIGDRIGEESALGNLGAAYAALGNAHKAIGYYEKQLVIVCEIGHRRGESAALGNLGSAYAALGNTRKAIEFYEKSLAIDREIGDRRGEGNILQGLGASYTNLGNAHKAIGYYEKQLVTVRAIGDQRGEGAALCNLGLAYTILGDARKAIEFYKQALAIHHEIGDQRGKGNDLGNLGLAYFSLGNARQAIELYEEALIIDREIGDRRTEGSALGNLGNAYLSLGNARKAIEIYEQCLKIHREIGDITGMAAGSFNMAILYAQQGETARALTLAQEAAQLYEQTGHPEYIQRTRQLVVRLQGGGAPPQADLIQAAFDAFRRAGSLQEMQAAAVQYSMLKDKHFVQTIEQLIREQVPPEHKPVFEQRLAWLKQIAGK